MSYPFGISARWFCWVGVALAGPEIVQAQYGVYYDEHGGASISRRDGNRDMTQHPYVDGVLLRFRWADLEPESGRFDFTIIDSRVKPWAQANKKVIIGVGFAGQRRDYTPDWVKPLVPQIKYVRSGKGFDVTQAKSWDPKFLQALTPLVRALGRRYASDPAIGGVMVGGGHIGFITAVPDKNGSQAYLAAGWTPDLWIKYNTDLGRLFREAFPDKPLIVRGSDVILSSRDPARDGFPGHKPRFIDVRDTILLEAASKYNASIGCNGLAADPERFKGTGIPAMMEKLAPGAQAGKYQLEISDDWPIWVPPGERRGVNAGKDNTYFKTCLENAIGGVRGIPKTNVSFIKMLASDLECTDPRSKNYQADCAEKLKWFKSQLLKPPRAAGGRSTSAP